MINLVMKPFQQGGGGGGGFHSDPFDMLTIFRSVVETLIVSLHPITERRRQTQGSDLKIDIEAN